MSKTVAAIVAAVALFGAFSLGLVVGINLVPIIDSFRRQWSA